MKLNKKTGEAKQKELELWEQENIYKEAPSEGQKIISTWWVVSPKAIIGVIYTKVHLIARGFEENIRLSSPICLCETRICHYVKMKCRFWEVVLVKSVG